jgi:hypothetical protein
MGHKCQTVRHAGFGSKKNGELLTIAEGQWDVLLTSDRNIKYQQNMPDDHATSAIPHRLGFSSGRRLFFGGGWKL